MTRETLTQIITALLILLFVYTAMSKLLDFTTFKHQMYNQPFPLWLGDIVVWLVPVSELVAAGLLLTPRLRVWGLLCSFGLMLVFSIYVALVYVNAFGRVPCSCGGVIASMSWGAHLVFNLCFTALAAVGLALEYRMGVDGQASLHSQ